jgi:hypothetical protein
MPKIVDLRYSPLHAARRSLPGPPLAAGSFRPPRDEVASASGEQIGVNAIRGRGLAALDDTQAHFDGNCRVLRENGRECRSWRNSGRGLLPPTMQ